MGEILHIIGMVLIIGFGLFVFVAVAVCAIAPLFISKDSTTGRKPLVKLGEGRGQAK